MSIRVFAVVPAGGAGVRFGGSAPKQFAHVAGRSVLDWSIRRLLEATEQVVVALPESLVDSADSVYRDDVRVRWAAGGPTRARSVRAALAMSSAGPDDLVAVHDGARPALSAVDLAAVIEAARCAGGAVLGRPVSDTLKAVEEGRVVATVDRSRLCRAETPQVFVRSDLEAALDRAAADGLEPTDESAAIERLRGVAVRFVEARRPNPKITVPGDLQVVERLLATAS